MKKVVKTSEIAHLWANQLQDEARNAQRNFYFEGNTIYSYGAHFPIAKHVEYNGKRTIFFTTKSYSVTTAGHIQMVRSACSHKDKIYVHNVEVWNSWDNTPRAYVHKENFEHWQKELESIGEKLLRARKKEIYIMQINNINDNITDYCTFFGINRPEILIQLTEVNKESYRAYLEQKQAKIRKEKEEKERKELEKFNVELELWKNFQLNSTWGLYNPTEREYLRYDQLKEVVETTKRVFIPLREALCFHALLKAGRIKLNMHLLGYTVEKITDKIIKIGCHTFDIDYLLKFGDELKMINSAEFV